MKYLILLLLTSFGSGQLAAQPKGCDKLVQRGDTTICQDFNGKGRVFREHYYLNDERMYTRRWRYKKNGEYECVQKNGKSIFAPLHGPAYRYYPNGQVKYQVAFYDGKRVGKCFSYYPSGALKQTCQMNDKGKEDGILVSYYENGQIESKARWENGRLREIIEYKDEQGRDRPTGSFKDGNGDWVWYEKGQPAIVYTYKDGKPVKKKRVNS